MNKNDRFKIFFFAFASGLLFGLFLVFLHPVFIVFGGSTLVLALFGVFSACPKVEDLHAELLRRAQEREKADVLKALEARHKLEAK